MGEFIAYNPNLIPANFEAKKSKRFINYLIDHCLVTSGSLFFIIWLTDNHGLSGKQGIIIFFSWFILYYTISEYFFGKTIGKFISRAEVVDENFKRPSLLKVLARSICRLIPYDPFSALVSYTTWHDSITKTVVVNSKRETIVN